MSFSIVAPMLVLVRLQSRLRQLYGTSFDIYISLNIIAIYIQIIRKIQFIKKSNFLNILFRIIKIGITSLFCHSNNKIQNINQQQFGCQIYLIIINLRANSQINFNYYYQQSSMELIAYRSLYLTISSNQHLIKSIAILAKVSQIVYPDKNNKQKKARCWLCNRVYDHALMLIMHLEIVHPCLVEKYQVRNQSLSIILRQRQFSEKSENEIAGGFVVGLCKNANFSTNKYNYGGSQLSMTTNFSDSENPAFLKNSFSARCKSIVNNIVQKIQRAVIKKQHIYFHSTNIFRKVDPNLEAADSDSEDDIGQVERQLQKLRIEDFSDVNDNDKKFFIEWNGFIHENKRKLSIIFTHDMPNMFVQFSKIAYQKGIPRINLVIHAWTLWSVGQITSNDVIKGLSEYDNTVQGIINLTNQSQVKSNGNNNNSSVIIINSINPSDKNLKI